MTQKAQTLPNSRYWDGLLVIITISAICMVGFRLYVTEWTDHLDILVYISFLAGVTGLVLGYSKFSTPIAMLFSTLYGTFIIGWLMGTTVSIKMSWHNRIINYLGWRLRMALFHFRHDEAINDPILFLMLMAVILWILASIGSFIVVRKGRVWQLVIPFGIALLVVGHYDRNLSLNAGYLFAFLFAFLVIVGRAAFLKYQNNWQQEGIVTNAGARADLSKSLLMLSILLLGLAWLIPLTSSQIKTSIKIWNSITDQWDRFSDRVEEIFTFESGTRRSSSEIFFQNDMMLGTGSQPSSAPVFTVEALSNVPSGYRHYWRTRSYDTYEDGSWSFNINYREALLYPDDFEIAYPEWESSQIATYRFTTEVLRTNVIYAPGRPIWVDRPVQANIVSLSESEEDLIGLVAVPEMATGDTYEVQALINLPTIEDLRASGMDYPEWTAPYLQLPEDFPDAITELTVNLFQDIENPYDMTTTVTQYLRDNITYTSTITPIPEGEDAIAWFLFESQEGFCNYFATAQVLMLRSVGIPARLSVGYTQGDYDEISDTYTVLEFNSHAWPEVYFENYGWIIFEPTVSEAVYSLPNRPPQNENFLDPGLSNLPLIDTEAERTPEIEGLVRETDGNPITVEDLSITTESDRTWISLLIAALLIIAIIVFKQRELIILHLQRTPVYMEILLIKMGIKVPGWLQHWSMIAQLPEFEKAYRQLSHSLKLMGHPLNLAETPAERAQALSQLIPEVSTPAQTIAEDYYVNKYSRGDDMPDEKRARFAAYQVKRLARRSWWQDKFHFWQKILPKKGNLTS